MENSQFCGTKNDLFTTAVIITYTICGFWTSKVFIRAYVFHVAVDNYY